MDATAQAELATNNPFFAATALTFAGIFAIFVLAFYVITIIAMWRLFTKTGEAGWKSLIPVYNAWIFLRLGNQAGWWALVAFVPVINIVALIFMVIAAYNIGTRFGKEGWYVVIFLLFPTIWMLILAFDNSTWNTTAPGAIRSPIAPAGEAPKFVPPADKNSGL